MLKEENTAAATASLAWESTVRRTLAAKRGGGVFCMSGLVAHVDDDGKAILTKPNTNASDSDNNIHHVERLFPSGDFYTGDWSESHPSGTGKYLWTDGCMYEGEWVKGNTAGKGKFSWPSGATFEGEFNRGYMDGFGTYTGCTGETYKGFWVMNLKHGSGHKSYASGDYYEGSWRFGAQEGQGRYVWNNGNEYIGEWKKGVICGKGSLLWANGNRYEGHWEDGLPKGYGIFTWADGSCYVGTWSKDPEEQSGTYYPSASSASPDVNLGWDQQVIFTVDLNECRVSQAEKMSIMPSQKTFHWPDGDIRLKHGILRSSKVADSSRARRGCSVDGVAKVCSVDGTGRKSAFEKNSSWELDEDITGDIVDGNPISVPVTPVKHGREDGGLDAHYKGGSRQQPKWQPREVKKQGETISKGHKNYELMLNLQLGIRHSVARPGPPTNNELRPSAFDPKEKVWTKFPPEGSKHTPPHQSVEFKWKDYCPLVFRYLRRLFKIDAADYMLSLCGNDALRELSSPGKSGSFFYLTHDDRYMIKTMKKAEVKVLLRMLPSYYNHVRTYENTLVTKFFGLHCVKLTGANQKKVRFVIMGNLFCSEYITHRRFDLKGSSHGRTTDKPEAEIDGTTTLKDLDLNFLFRLQKSWFQEFHRQVDRDCEFLEAERIMDYSLLVGLHFKDSSRSADLLSDGSSETDQRSNCVGRLSRAEAMDRDTNWRSSIRLGVNMPARVEQTMRRSNGDAQLIGDATGDTYNVILFVGIIDILQDYDISKKLEHAYKSIQYDATSISAVDPRQYSKRFRDFIYKIFIEDT